MTTIANPKAAYVHVPFCAHHCCYCDFAVVAGRDHLIADYLDALSCEIVNALSEPQTINTLFIGGGTPTHLTPDQLALLFETLRRWFRFTPNAEISVEANPATLTVAKINALADHGVNRISLGAQSFHSETLSFLERDHSPVDIKRTVELVRERIDNVSLDLIFGVPGQSLNDWRHDIETAMHIGPDHISTYGLTIEKGTPLWKRVRDGSVEPAFEQIEYDMYQLAMDTLSAAGYEHYEISNFAQPGRRCRHNETYWANESYWGFGLGATRYVDYCRATNTRDMSGYVCKAKAGETTIVRSETLTPMERARETMAIQLRRIEGIHTPRFREQTGFDLQSVAGEPIRRMGDLEYLDVGETQVRLTRKGKFVADAVIAELLTQRDAQS